MLLNVYFPTTGPDGDDEFSHYIGRRTLIIAECDEKMHLKGVIDLQIYCQCLEITSTKYVMLILYR